MQTAKLSTLYSNRELLTAWTMRTIRARYKQSILGGMWAILQPTATAIIFSIIFTRFVKIDTGNIPYIVFSYTAMAPWTLFTSSISDMTDSLVANMNLVGKIYFPREILPIAAVLARLLDFAISLVLMALFMLFYRVEVSPTDMALCLADHLPNRTGSRMAAALLFSQPNGRHHCFLSGHSPEATGTWLLSGHFGSDRSSGTGGWLSLLQARRVSVCRRCIVSLTN